MIQLHSRLLQICHLTARAYSAVLCSLFSIPSSAAAKRRSRLPTLHSTRIRSSPYFHHRHLRCPCRSTRGSRSSPRRCCPIPIPRPRAKAPAARGPSRRPSRAGRASSPSSPSWSFSAFSHPGSGRPPPPRASSPEARPPRGGGTTHWRRRPSSLGPGTVPSSCAPSPCPICRFSTTGSSASPARADATRCSLSPRTTPRSTRSMSDGQDTPCSFLPLQTPRQPTNSGPRPRHLLQILDLGYNVMYNDVDMVWLKDPFQYFEGDHDVYFTDDMAAVKPPNHPHDLPPPGKKGRTYICSCMIYLRPTSGAKLVMRKWIEELQAEPWSKTKKSNDQPAFNWALNKTAGQVDLYLLPQAAFPSGGLYFKNQTWVQETKGMHAIIHNNYITGFEKKIKRFREFRLWLADDYASESPLGKL